MDGDQGEHESELGVVCLVEQAVQSLRRQRDGKPVIGGQADAPGRISGDQALLFEGPEQAAQRGVRGLCWACFEGGGGCLDVGRADLAQAGDVLCSCLDDRVEVAEVSADGARWHLPVSVASLAAEHLDPAEYLAGEGLGQGVEAVEDGLLVDVGGCGVGCDDETVGVEEPHDPFAAGPGDVGGDGADVWFRYRCLGAEPAEQDPQRSLCLRGDAGVPLFCFGLFVELVEECLRRRGGRGKGGEVQAAPVPARGEQLWLVGGE